jgi:hypothetical protein
VPKLDLSKAKEIQDYNLKRLLEQQHKNKDGEESSAVRKEKIIRYGALDNLDCRRS